jgi:RND family efflux transporter MFP subunit
MKPSLLKAPLAALLAALLLACTQKPPAEAMRSVRTVELDYAKAWETDRYSGTVQARYEVNQAFRVSGKVVERKVDVGQTVRKGDVLGVLDDSDYRLAEQAAREQLVAAQTHARQAESDRARLDALKIDGSVSPSDDEHAQSAAKSTKAAAEAAARQLELARNRLNYTVLRASRNGVVTAVRFEVGQVVAEGQPVVSVADESEPEVVVDVPEDRLATFETARFQAVLASEPSKTFDVVLRELSPQAAAQTRTYRARLRPATPRLLPLGATATLIEERAAADTRLAEIPASALTQSDGQPAVWVVHREGSKPVGTVSLMPVVVQGYRNDAVLIFGPPAGELVVTAGVQKMAPGLRVALLDNARGLAAREASR